MSDRSAVRRSETFLLGIAGGSGSGKTTLANAIEARAGRAAADVIQHDWYYRDRSQALPGERASINYDEPAALDNELLADHLRLLKSGVAVDCPQYDFATRAREERARRVTPRPVLIVEGILLFCQAELRGLLDLRVFVDTDADLRLLRRVRRDISERGRDIAAIEAQYLGSVRPMHLKHVAPTRRYADLIVADGSGEDGLAGIMACLPL